MRFVKVVVAVALAVVGVIAFDMQSGKGNDADAGPALAQQPDPTLSQLSVFRRGRDARDELPALAARSLAAQPAGSGQNPALSRAVQLPSGPRYLIPGNGVVGFFTAYGNGGVSAIADVLAGQVVASEMCLDVLRSGQLRVVGLLPDSASNRAIILRNGKRVDDRDRQRVRDDVHARERGGAAREGGVRQPRCRAGGPDPRRRR
jgi:hypothetical protein